MRGALPTLIAAMAAIPLSGCVIAAVPVVAGAAVVGSEQQRKQKQKPKQAQPAATATSAAAPTALPGSGPRTSGLPGPSVAPAAPAVPSGSNSQVNPAFDALVAHVQRRATLWREGAPINSLVLDARQSVLNPVAVGCARRPPVVIVDLDRDPSAATTGEVAAWPATLAALRAHDVGIVWVSDAPAAMADRLRTALVQSALDPAAADRLMLKSSSAGRKQLMRQDIARDSCVLAVVGDVRADADEAYGYLRSSTATLPIDSNWGEGWFLLPAPPLPVVAP